MLKKKFEELNNKMDKILENQIKLMENSKK